MSLLFKLGASYLYKIARNNTNKFWSDVLYAWGETLECMPTPQYSPQNEPLWLNPKVSKTELYLSNWSGKGISTISDVMMSDGKFLSELQITRAFNIKTNYLEYHRVISCIKLYLNKTNSKDNVILKPTIPNQIRLISKSKKGCKVFYNVLKGPENVSDNIPNWVKKLDTEVNTNMWKHSYITCFNTIQDNSLRWLQYKILNNILGTKAYRYKVKLSDSPLCSMCNHSDETCIHLFATCEKVRCFWQNLQSIILQNTNFMLNIDTTNIIFGYHVHDKFQIPVNVIYMAAKKYIFQTSRHQKILNIQEFQKIAQQIFIEQECIAKLEFKHQQFLKKWYPLARFFQM